MTDQPQPGPDGDTSAADPGHNRKTSVERVTLGTGQTMVLANYGQRFRARIADSLLIGIGFAVAVIAKLWVDLSETDLFGPSVPRPITARLVLPYVAFVPLLLYEIVAVAWRGKTLGMRTEGIRVVSIETGHAPSMDASLWRGMLLAWLVPLVLYLLLYDMASEPDAMPLVLVSTIWVLLAHLSVFWGENRRGWHDLISGTVVVTSDPPVPADPPSGDACANAGTIARCETEETASRQ